MDIPIILCAVAFGILVGILICKQRIYSILKDSKVGYLNMDDSTPNEIHLFLDLDKKPQNFIDKKYVVMEITRKEM